jgi:hypothetical protein
VTLTRRQLMLLAVAAVMKTSVRGVRRAGGDNRTP